MAAKVTMFNKIWKTAASTWTRNLDWPRDFLTDIVENSAVPCDSGKTHGTRCSASRNSSTSFATKNRTRPSLCCTAVSWQTVQVYFMWDGAINRSLVQMLLGAKDACV